MSYTLRQDANARPVLETARLRLRLPQMADLPASAAFWASERAHLMGGPWTAEETAAEFQGLLDQWAKHGFSLFTVTRKGSDDGIGGIGPFYPDTHPEPELGWSLWNAADEGPRATGSLPPRATAPPSAIPIPSITARIGFCPAWARWWMPLPRIPMAMNRR
jgi:hypothetical protein